MIRALASRSGHWMPDRAMARYSRAEGSTRSRADRARTRPTAHQASAQRIEPRGTCADGKQGSGIERVLGTGGRDRPGGGRMLAVDAAGASGAEEPFLGRSADSGLRREQRARSGILALREVLPAGGDEKHRPIGTAEGAGGDLPRPDSDLRGHLAALIEP